MKGSFSINTTTAQSYASVYTNTNYNNKNPRAKIDNKYRTQAVRNLIHTHKDVMHQKRPNRPQDGSLDAHLRYKQEGFTNPLNRSSNTP